MEVKSWIIPGAAESEIMRQPNYADNCVAVSSLYGVSDTDKCLLVTAHRGEVLTVARFYYRHSQAAGTWTTIVKQNWDEIQPGRVQIFPFSALLHS